MGLLFLRIFMGYAMAMHGMDKMSHPFGWMDQGPQPSGVPGFLQGLGAAGEFFGGLGLIFGLLTPIAALGVMSTMFVSMLFLLGMPGPHYFMNAPMSSPKSASLEVNLAYFIFALTLFLTGPGLLSIDAFLFGRQRAVAAPAATAPTATPPVTPVVKT